MIEKKCLACQKPIFHYPCRVKKCCSIKCKVTGKFNGRYKGDNYSFTSTRKPNYQGKEIQRKYVRSDGGWRPEHLVKAEKVLGRRVKKGEVVHHINCDPMDNRNENLLICSKAYHQWLHQYMGYMWAQQFANAKTIKGEAVEVIEEVVNA